MATVRTDRAVRAPYTKAMTTGGQRTVYFACVADTTFLRGAEKRFHIRQRFGQTGTLLLEDFVCS